MTSRLNTDIICYSPSIARISTPVDITKQAVGTGFVVENTSGKLKNQCKSQLVHHFLNEISITKNFF